MNDLSGDNSTYAPVAHISDFACDSNCKYANGEWPAHLPKPTCRLFYELNKCSNPVTVSVLKEIIKKRVMSCQPET